MDKPPVVIVPYDPDWPRRFESEAALIQKQVGFHLEAIEHIGSTSVPGLGAKPILDIMPGIRRLSDAQRCIDPLGVIGYEYVPEYEDEMPERRYFRKGPPEARTHHVHMVKIGSEFWERHLVFRDYLRTHPATAREYEALKRRLADLHATDRVAYTDAKTAFIQGIVREAREGNVPRSH